MEHDLHAFMRQLTLEMSAEYERIHARATEDPGTAGDQGEENWAELLREWLPSQYKVVTKGRIIGHDGRTSPQIDIAVLNSVYPRKLLTKKLYLAAGVVAAFECKTTLKASHIADAVRTCAKIKGLYQDREGTPYKELHSPIVYGVLAHSHSWKNAGSSPAKTILGHLVTADRSHVDHPRSSLDMLCVADLGTWSSVCIPYVGPRQLPSDVYEQLSDTYGPDGSAITSYMGYTPSGDDEDQQATAIGAFISHLTRRLGWEHPELRDLAMYYLLAEISGGGHGPQRMWPSSVYSDAIRSRVEAGGLMTGEPWNEWSVVL